MILHWGSIDYVLIWDEKSNFQDRFNVKNTTLFSPFNAEESQDPKQVILLCNRSEVLPCQIHSVHDSSRKSQNKNRPCTERKLRKAELGEACRPSVWACSHSLLLAWINI